MEPTNRLRFVEREEKHWLDDRNYSVRRIRILQQWWAPFRTIPDGYGYRIVELEGGEWRDIPLEEEA